MAKHIVMCRTCRNKFDAKEEEKGTYWIMPSRNWYYHKECYENWKASGRQADDSWKEMIYDLISRDLKGSYNWNMIEAQRKKFLKDKMTNKGIYYSLYWYFILKKHEWKSDYGIGIVPHIYKEATSFWVDKANKNSAIYKQIEKLAEDRKSEAITIKKKDKKKKNIKAPDEF